MLVGTVDTSNLYLANRTSQITTKLFVVKTMGFKRNDRVFISRGNYSGKFATYLSDAGTKGLSGNVRIDGDSVKSRCLRLASFQKVARESIPKVHKTGIKSEAGATVTVSVTKLECLIETVAYMSKRLEVLEQALREIKNNTPESSV